MSELSAEDQSKIAELDEALSRFESQKRWSDYLRTLVSKAKLVTDNSEKVTLWRQAAQLYLEKSSNQAEAIKCYEAVLEIEAQDEDAISKLRDLYERRRDWERLLKIMRLEADRMTAGDRAARFVEMAKLATERVRKPELCIELWQEVINSEPDHPEALQQLVGLYERAKQWDPLAQVLEKVADHTVEPTERVNALQKLGVVYADKLNNDEGAVRTFQRILEVDPNERRAQEQLRKRYIALKAWDDLETFFGATERWDELIRTLEREAEQPDATAEQKVDLLFRVARLWDERKEKKDRAARAYEKILDLDKQNLRAAEALSPIYEAAGDVKKLVGVYQIRIAKTEDALEKKELLIQAAKLYEERLKDPKLAFESAIQAVAVDPADISLTEEAERLAAVAQGWQHVVETYRQVLETGLASSDAQRLRVRLGRVLSNQGQIDEAVKEFQEALLRDAEDAEALEALEQLYRQSGRLKDLLGLVEQRLEIETDPTRRHRLELSRAHVLEHELHDDAQAIEVYKRLVEENPLEAEEALQALDRLYTRTERWSELVPVLEQLLELAISEPNQVVDLKHRLADVYRLRLMVPQKALDLYREVLLVAPEHAPSLEALEALQREPSIGLEAAQLLEPMYEMLGQWDKLLVSLEVQVQAAPEADTKSMLLLRMASIAEEQLQDKAKAFDAYARAFRQTPEQHSVLQSLEEIAAGLGKSKELVGLLREQAAQTTNPTLARSLWIRAADLSEHTLQDVEGAVQAYSKVLDVEPGDLQVLGALEELFRRHERWKDLISVLRKRAETQTDPTERVASLAQIARVQTELTHEPTEAIRTYREILESEPDNQEALGALDELLERERLWSDLADHLQRRLSLISESQAQTHLMLRLAGLHEQQMNSVESALELYREVLALDPQNAAAVTALERHLGDATHRTKAAEVLEPLYQQHGEFQKLVQVVEQQAADAQSVESRVQLLRRAAELYEVALDDAQKAFSTMARAFEQDPSSAELQHDLERLAELTGNWKGLVEVYESSVSKVDEPSLQSLLHRQAGAVYETRLNDDANATVHYRKALQTDATHMDAVLALERLLQTQEQYDELAQLYLSKATMVVSLDEQKEALFKAAFLFEEVLEKLPSAVDVYEKVRGLDAEDATALDKLAGIYAKLENWDKLLEVYQGKAEIISEVEEKKRVLLEMGGLYEREKKDTTSAIATYQQILDLDSEDAAALAHLDTLYQATGNSKELLRVLEQEAQVATDPDQVLHAKYRIAELWEHQLGDPSQAVEGYREILSVSPEHEASIRSLTAMVKEGREPLAAAAVLDPLLRSGGQWQLLVDVLQAQMEHESEPDRRVELLHQVADLYELQLEQPEGAFSAYARALSFDALNERSLLSLERLAEGLQKWPSVATLYDQEIEKLVAQERPESVELGARVAQIYEIYLSDAAAATTRYRQVMNQDSGRVDVLQALDRLYEGAENWSELAEVLQTEIQSAASPDEMLHFHYRLGKLYSERLSRPDAAIQHYKEILAAAPEHEEAISALEGLLRKDGKYSSEISEILEPVYRMQQAWDRLIAVYEMQLTYLAGTEERVSMLHRISEVAEERLADHSLSFQWMLRALLEDPQHEHTDHELLRLAQILDGWGDLAHGYIDVLEKEPDAKVGVYVGKKLAQLYLTQLGDVERAEETCRYVLSKEEYEAETLEILDRIYAEHGAAQALAEVLRRRVKDVSAADAVELNYRLGRVLEAEIQDLDAAKEIYQRILADLDSQHLESIRALYRIYQKQGDNRQALATLEKELDAVMGDSARADILAKMARLASERLQDDTRAIELWRRVLDVRGEDPEALNALGDLYTRQENWRDLVDILERESAIAADDASRIRIFADLGRIWYEKLQRDKSALESWERILDMDPSNAEALMAMAHIYQSAQSHNELAETLERLLRVASTELSEADLERITLQLAELYRGPLSRFSDAEEAYEKALQINPRNFQALHALENMFREQEDWQRCIAVLERRAQVLEEPQEKIQLWLSIAEMWDVQVGERDRGVHALEEVLALDPLHAEAFASLESLHKEAQRWDALIELYLQRTEATADADERIVWIRKIARVYEEELQDMERAFEALLLAWSEDYTREDTARELERVAAATQKWNEVLTHANEALGQTQDPNVRMAISLRCAHWYGVELRRPDYALPYYQQILSVDPINVPATRQMAELYRSLGQWQQLAQTWLRLSEIVATAPEKADTFVLLGRLYEENLDSTEQGLAYYHHALELDSQHVGALEALERVFHSQEKWDELLEVLERKVHAVQDAEVQLQAKLNIAQVHESLEHLDEAIAAYSSVLQMDATRLDALRGLERLYTARERWQDLAQTLESQLEVLSSDKERVQVLSRLARLWEEEFIKPDKAAEKLEALLEIDPYQFSSYEHLGRLYRNLQRWPDLVRSLERYVEAVPERKDKTRTYVHMGQVLSQEIGDVDRAIDAYMNALDLDPEDVEALQALSTLHEKKGDYHSALQVAERLSNLIQEPTQVVELRYRMGSMIDQHLGDRTTAIEWLQSAVDVDSAHVPSLEALGRIFVESGEWPSAVRVLEQLVTHQTNPRQVSKVWVDLGTIYQEQLDDHERAVASFEAAYQQDPDNEQAMAPLSHEYMNTQRWSEAVPILQALVARSAKRSPEDQHQLNMMLGQSAAELQDFELATRAFSKAHQLQPNHLPSLQGLANSHYQAQEWEKAFRYYQMLLVHHRDALGKEEITDIFYRLGVIKREQNEGRKALNMFDKALEENAHHRPTLEAVVAFHQAQNEFEQVIHFKKQLLQAAEEDERGILLEEIGDLWQEKLKNPQKAIQSYVEAAEGRPNDHRILHKLLGLYQDTRQWDKAIETIERICALDERPTARSKYIYTIGVILRDELKNADEAMVRFNEALDLDPTQLKPFEAVNKILTQKKDWKQLERAFRKMLHRILGQDNADLEFNLWHNLGVIYRDRLKQFESAAEAFSMASKLRPDSATEHQILAELYSIIPARLDDAIAEHQWILRQDPYLVDSYRALYKLYFDARAYDKAWCVSSALVFLKSADQEQSQFYEQYRLRGMIRPQSRLDHQKWVKELFHPDEDVFVGKIFEAVLPAILAIKQQTDKDYGLAKKHQVDPATSTAAFAKAFGFVSQVLDTPTPRLFLRPDVQGGLAYAVTIPPASVCGSSLLTNVNPQDLTFVIAKHLSYYRAEHYLRRILPTAQELKMVLLAAMRLANQGPADPAVDQTAEQLRAHTQPVQLEALTTIAKRFMEAGARADIKRWMRAVEFTACRAGFLICNDLEIAARMIQAEPPDGPADVPPKEKVTETLLFGVSESYFHLREVLGIQIKIG